MQGPIGMHRHLNNERGFSLIELLVVLVIAGILLGVGLPSFKDFLATSKMADTNNALVHSIQLARSTAVERLEATGVCVSDAPMIDDASCAVGSNYNNGWLVYVDSDGDGVRDLAEDILERVDAPGPAFTFEPTTTFENQIYFNDSGASINVAGVPISGTIEIDYGDGTQVRVISVSANGRVSTKTTKAGPYR